jgi:hypothetical protein
MRTAHQPFEPPAYARAAFAELGRISVDGESMDSVLQRVAQLAKGTIPGVAESSVTVVTNDKATSAAYTGRLALDLDESQYGRGYGPCLEAAVGRELVEIIDAREETRWPDYAQGRGKVVRPASDLGRCHREEAEARRPAPSSRRRTTRRVALTWPGGEHRSCRFEPQSFLQRLGEGAGQDHRRSSPRF